MCGSAVLKRHTRKEEKRERERKRGGAQMAEA
jgi:hypothetical protein